LNKESTALSKSQYSTNTSYYQHDFPQSNEFSIGTASQQPASKVIRDSIFSRECSSRDSQPYSFISWRDLGIWV